MPAVAALAPALGTAFVHTQLVCNVHTLAPCCSKVRLQCFMHVYASCSAYNVLLHNGCSHSVLWLLVLRLRCVHRDLGECDGMGLAPARKISQPQAVGFATNMNACSSCCGKLTIFVARWSRHVCATSVAWWSTADLKTASLVFVRCNGFVPHVCLFSRCSDRLGREGDASACLRASFACCCGRPVGGCLVGGSGLVATSGAWTAAAGST